MVVGILLPDSSTHPLISHDVLAGFKSAVSTHAIEGVELAFGYVAFGTSAEVLKKEVEKLILERDVDLIIAFVDHPIVDTIFPLISQLNKTLLVINHGAKYAFDWVAPANVYFHTLENCFCSFLTSKYALTNVSKAAVATSYYDGGYSLCHAITQPFMDGGGEIVFNFAGMHKLEEFDTKGLAAFLIQNPDTQAVFTVLSGNLLAEYYTQLNRQLPELTLNLYSQPVLLEETITEHQAIFPENYRLTAYTTWYEGVQGAENEVFCNTIEAATGRRPTSFGVLGWDTALIVQQLIAMNRDGGSVPEISGAKGRLVLDEKTHHFLSDIHRVSFSAKGGVVLEETLTSDDGRGPFGEMVAQKIEGITSGWLNTYLCS